MKMNKIITKKKFKEQYDQRSDWVGLYYQMKQKRNRYRMAFKGVSLITIMSFFVFFSLTEAIRGRMHIANTLLIAGMGFSVWSASTLIDLFYGVE